MAAGCAVLVAGAGQSSGAESPLPLAGLTATASGAAFAHSPAAAETPVMSVGGLAPGRGTSGMVTVRNPTRQNRLFWLSQTDVRDSIGPRGGRLSDSLQLSVLDVTRLSSPSSLYRGPATGLGVRPLGFLAPGASRTYSLTASLPDGPGPPSAPATNSYEGSTAAFGFAWRAIEGSPVARSHPSASAPVPSSARAAAPGQTKVVTRPRGDRRPPSVRITVPGRQQLLQARALSFTVNCDESCRQSVKGVVTAGGHRWGVPVVTSSQSRRRQSLRLVFPAPAYLAVRSGLLAGHSASVKLSVRAVDHAGNRTTRLHAIRLKGR